MTAWPDNMNVDPIGEWPGTLTPERTPSNFSASWSATLKLLDREIYMLGGTNMRLQVSVPASQFRLDGRPRADAKALHPGVILTLDSRFGPLSYPCDTFATWQENVRAIALALEALRKVNRYGVTKHGEQYRGFLAIEAPTPPTDEFLSPEAARSFLREVAGWGENVSLDDVTLVRIAKRWSHPDMAMDGGSAELFQRVTLAEQYLKQNGAMK